MIAATAVTQIPLKDALRFIEGGDCARFWNARSGLKTSITASACGGAQVTVVLMASKRLADVRRGG